MWGRRDPDAVKACKIDITASVLLFLGKLPIFHKMNTNADALSLESYTRPTFASM